MPTKEVDLDQKDNAAGFLGIVTKHDSKTRFFQCDKERSNYENPLDHGVDAVISVFYTLLFWNTSCFDFKPSISSLPHLSS